MVAIYAAGLSGQSLVVVNEEQQSLVGVAVYSADYKQTTTSTAHGTIDLRLFDSTTVLTFSYIGYQKVTLPLDSLRQIDTLQLDILTNTLQAPLIVGRKEELASEIPYQLSIIKRANLELTAPATAADALSQHANVYVQKSQLGGGSPVLRGFEANKVLLVVDGVRMNNAIYRSGHLQNAITIDAGILEQVDVIYGPGSLSYGSDALGGVVHFQTRTPQLAEDNTPNSTTNLFLKYASANRGKTYHFDQTFSRKKWASLTSISFNDFGDVRIGQQRSSDFPDFGKRLFTVASNYDRATIDTVQANPNPNVQLGSAYRQWDMLQKFYWKPIAELDVTANFQYSTSSDVSRYDNLIELNSTDPSDLRFAEWYYGPQDRWLASLKTRLFQSNRFFDRALWIVAYQRIAEDRHSRRFGRTARRFNLEDVQVWSSTMDFQKQMGSSQLSYGLDWSYNQVSSTAGNEEVRTGAITYDETTRYPSGGSQMNTLGTYLNYKWKSADSLWTLHSGLRYTTTKTFSLFGQDDPIQWSPSYYINGVTNVGQDLNWGIGWTLQTPNGWQANIHAATAFRAPNLDDFSKIRVNNGFVTIPNPDLNSERSINGELTIGKIITWGQQRLQLNGTGFYTRLRNAIVRSDFPLPDGNFELEFEEATVQTQANINASEATIYGFSFNLDWKWHNAFSVRSSLNWTKGTRPYTFEDQGDTQHLELPLDHIPPLYGRTSLQYHRSKLQARFTATYHAAKRLEDYAVRSVTRNETTNTLEFNRTGTADNLELTARCADETYCVGTPAWIRLDIHTTYKLTSFLSLNLAVENLADVHYRPFASGISAAGRNWILGLRIQL